MVGHLHLQDILESGYTDREKARCLRLDCGNKIGNHKKMIDRYNSVGMENLVFTTPDYDYLKGIRKFTQTELDTHFIKLLIHP